MKNIIEMSCFSSKQPEKNENEDFYLPPSYDNNFNIVLLWLMVLALQSIQFLHRMLLFGVSSKCSGKALSLLKVHFMQLKKKLII